MRYPDGQEIHAGDLVKIDERYRGTVVGCIDAREYLPPHRHEDMKHLGGGVMIDTDFGGLVHYPDAESLSSEPVVLLKRGANV